MKNEKKLEEKNNNNRLAEKNRFKVRIETACRRRCLLQTYVTTGGGLRRSGGAEKPDVQRKD